jgi:hypothetical protein
MILGGMERLIGWGTYFRIWVNGHAERAIREWELASFVGMTIIRVVQLIL